MYAVDATCKIAVIDDLLVFEVEEVPGVEIYVKLLPDEVPEFTREALYSLMDNLTILHRDTVRKIDTGEWSL